MGTSYSIKYVGELKVSKEQIDQRLIEVNNVFSTYQRDSEITLFNKHKSLEPFKVSEEMISLAKYGVELSKLSDGAFDPTVGPIVNLWGFGPAGKRKVPTEAEIAKAIDDSGHTKLVIDEVNKTLSKLRENLYLDCSAFAKGYGADQVALVLEKAGIHNYMVEIGGEIRAKGNKNGHKWRIGIERPEVGARSVTRIIELNDIGLATSGNYRNFFKENGHHYSHTVDVKTGRPVPNKLASVTVVHRDGSMQADAWATVIMVLGPERGLELAEKEGIGAWLLILADDVKSNNDGTEGPRQNELKFVERSTSHFEKILSESTQN